MAYGIDQLRKGVAALRGMDDAYSAKIAQMYEGSNPAVQAGAYMVGGAHPSLRKGEVDRVYGPETMPQRVGRQAMEYALPAVNAVPKYVLPAAGVTLAGKALIDMANVLGQQTSTTLEPK